MSNKLTDKEIVKALECCGSNAYLCGECPYKRIDNCELKLSADALDLINRLQAENERLKNANN